jgi:predicted XRE-type DNA-binding protein
MTATEGILGEVFASVWDALEDSPEAAANLRLRSELLIAIREKVTGWGVTQAEAAHRLDVTQPRLNDLLRGRIDKFSLDALVLLAAKAGLVVHLKIAGRGVKIRTATGVFAKDSRAIRRRRVRVA